MISFFKNSHMKKLFLFAVLIHGLNITSAQTTRVLFIGNSYTYVNDLPQLFHDIALSKGDTVIFDSYTPGGYTLQGHSTDANTITKINSQQWDYVVLQEQSQRPSFSPSQVASQVLPYASVLDSMIHANNPCTETVFYMTWGRKNGDASNCGVYPPVCTYEGMQARLRESYLLMAQQNGSTVSPVGASWKNTRDLNPAFDLYSPDESHPSIHGSYLAACTFYASIFHKSPSGSSFISTLTPADAALLQNMASLTVMDSLETWYQYGNIPYSAFSYTANGLTVQFQDESLNPGSWQWSFGDGGLSVLPSPSHTYAAPGTYGVSLITGTSCRSNGFTDSVYVTLTGLSETPAACEGIWLQQDNSMLAWDCGGEFDKLNIYSLNGQVVYRTQIASGQNYSSVFFPSAGIYFVELTSPENSIRKRLAVF
jgi:PKD repeat protein